MFKKLLLSVIVLSLSACIYKIDVHQGNVLDPSKVEQLKLGMSKKQVIALLGSPQLTDPFHTQRWDYFSSSKTENQRKQKSQILSLVFKNDRLSNINQ